MHLGCIADDLTGATDLALMLQSAGMRTIQLIGVPESADAAPRDVDAVVIALKSRTSPPAAAVSQSLAALAWLRARGAAQILFKYCSTFDSTDAGNIGPVADALLDAIGAPFTVACPAFPTNKRTVYLGHLFVGAQLLSDSPMQDHPLTPMRDANLVRVLGRQTRRKVGLVPLATVRQGAQAMREAFAALQASGHAYAVVDAVEDQDLRALGAACRDLALLTGGSGIAMGLPGNFGVCPGSVAAPAAVGGHAAILSGSCSAQSNLQVAHWSAAHPAFRIEPLLLAAGEDQAAAALAWAGPRLAEGPVLIYATARPDAVHLAQAKLGAHQAGMLVEACLAKIARGLVALGVRRLVVAGGETSGAVVEALGTRALRIGPAIDPGVPWTQSLGEPPLALALKSGNFGAVDFFDKALGMQT
ncbi:MAG: four-carbon acid sugar kinase family protein [Betaproteobacteria bacterium]|nr:four-carbon acid sugar kinase family protein [Betaproteobacteria bacterium]